MGVIEIFLVFFFTIGALYCWPTARAGAWVMRGVARAQGWQGEPETKAMRRAAVLVADGACAGLGRHGCGYRHPPVAAVPDPDAGQAGLRAQLLFLHARGGAIARTSSRSAATTRRWSGRRRAIG